MRPQVDEAGTPLERHLAADLATGALVTLVVITVVGATSTGVVQAARALDGWTPEATPRATASRAVPQWSSRVAA